MRRLFAPDHVDYVEARLRGAEIPLASGGPLPRIHIAVLWLSRGDLDRFDRDLAIALYDWRDSLVAAGLGNLDWRDVLLRAGIDPSGW